MIDDEVIQKGFLIFGKTRKGFLNKHEFKCFLIYTTGHKPDYKTFKQIWIERIKFYKDIQFPETPKFVTPDFAKYVLRNCPAAYPSAEKKAELEFQALDIEKKQYITYDDFLNLFKLFGAGFMTETLKRDLFNKIDQDGDGKISFKDYKSFINL